VTKALTHIHDGRKSIMIKKRAFRKEEEVSALKLSKVPFDQMFPWELYATLLL
jgi:hypothetical protein